MNFITSKLIDNIYVLVVMSQNKYNHHHFFYFNEPIIEDDMVIDRINRWNPYVKEKMLPYAYYSLKGSTLIEIYEKIKNEQFYYWENKNNNYKKVILNEV
jgi:hypothetical protein